MAFQITGETEPKLDISHHQMKPPVLGMGSIKLPCWPKGPHGKKKKTSSYCQHCWLVTQIDGKVLMIRRL